MEDSRTEAVIGAAFRVHNSLGYGFLESVYERALSIELVTSGLDHVKQAPVDVYYDDQVIGRFFVDILVNDCLVVELKSGIELSKAHEVQLVNYLTATNIKTGLLINFGPTKVTVRRKFLTAPDPSC